MCGFAGFLSFRSPEGMEERERILRTMSRSLAHRGPDDVQFYDDGTLALVFRRLAIVDVKSGRQPIFNELHDKLVVANGQIYNYRTLQQQLKTRHCFATDSDCEVLLHAFEEWGVEGLTHCAGMFAVAIWDKTKQQLLLARDRLGIKPLYVARLPDGLLFGSELKALLAHPRCPRDLDWSALPFEMRWKFPTRSYVKGVELLPGGHFLLADSAGRVTERDYWRLDDSLGSAPYGEDAERYVEALQDQLEETVHAHLQGEVRIGLHLSGGLDSSLLAALVAREKVGLPCFTVVERTTWRAGDVTAARRVADGLGLDWHPILFDYRSFLDDVGFGLERFEQAIWMMDSPRFDLEWLLKEELHRAAKTIYPDLKVILIGQGVDEYSGGYSNSLDWPMPDWHAYLTHAVEPMLQSGDEAEATVQSPYHRMMRLFSRQLQHHNLWHEDRTSMWHGLEARVPYLDHRIVELLASIPGSLHESMFWDKSIMRHCTRRIFPDFDATRPKIGFTATDDMRSIEILIHSAVVRILVEFREKYYGLTDFPFDRDEMDGLMRRVAAREPMFYMDMWQLLDKMAAVVFQAHCRRQEMPDYDRTRAADSRLEQVTDSRWPALETLFATQPVTAVEWSMDHVPHPPRESSIAVESLPGADRFTLLHGGQEVAMIEISASHGWAKSFLMHVGKGMCSDFTVKDWLDEYDLGFDEYRGMLDVLCQCGMIQAPLPHKLESIMH